MMLSLVFFSACALKSDPEDTERVLSHASPNSVPGTQEKKLTQLLLAESEDFLYVRYRSDGQEETRISGKRDLAISDDRGTRSRQADRIQLTTFIATFFVDSKDDSKKDNMKSGSMPAPSKPMQLSADEAFVHLKDTSFDAHGNVVFIEEGEARFESDEIFYDGKKKEFKTKPGKLVRIFRSDGSLTTGYEMLMQEDSSGKRNLSLKNSTFRGPNTSTDEFKN